MIDYIQAARNNTDFTCPLAQSQNEEEIEARPTMLDFMLQRHHGTACHDTAGIDGISSHSECT